MTLTELMAYELLWCGELPPEGPAAEPCQLEAPNGWQHIVCSGDFTEEAMERLATLIEDVRESDQSQVLVLNLASRSGSLRGLTPVIDQLIQCSGRLDVLCYLHEGIGPAFFIAQDCALVFAKPTARIGNFAVGLPRESPPELPGLQLFDELHRGCLHQGRPKVPAETWQRLERYAVTAEQAEAMGVIDGVRSTISTLT